MSGVKRVCKKVAKVAFSVVVGVGLIGFVTAIPVLNKNTCGRRLNFLIFRNNFISLST